MKRIEKIPNHFGSEDKYLLQEEYDGFGIYQEKCPSGFLVHQSYLLTDGKLKVVCESYNRVCIEELLDAIDEFNETGKLGLKTIQKDENMYIVHPSGTVAI